MCGDLLSDLFRQGQVRYWQLHFIYWQRCTALMLFYAFVVTLAQFYIHPA